MICLSAMRDVKGEYLLNGHWQIKQSHKFHAAGSKFFYQRAGHVQTIEAQGPTNKPLFIVVRLEIFWFIH